MLPFAFGSSIPQSFDGDFPAPGQRWLPRQIRYRVRRALLRLPLWQRLMTLAVMIPFLVGGGASGAFYLNLHRTSRALSLQGLPLTPAPTADRRILVIAPHCDDETLGVGGMLADARRAGAEVSVAFLTNGDGFPIAAGRELRDVRLSPADYIRFAEKRQREAIAAMSELGVPEDHVLFLGYPDRGIAALWETHWENGVPFRSRYTGHTRSPYTRTFTAGAVYSGASLLADIERLYREKRPTEIYVTHPADDHADHSTAATFAQAALLHAQDRNEGWSHAALLRYYLVHRGDWPLPQGNHPDHPLVPPASMSSLDTRWEVYPLSPEARDAKRRALEQYRSQMAVMRRFLVSFVRENEIYGTLPRLAPVASLTADDGAGSSTSPDAAADNVMRYAGSPADLCGVTVSRTSDALRIRLTTRGPISPRVRYRVLLRATGDRGDADTHYIALNLPRPADTTGANGATAAIDGNRLEWQIPYKKLGLPDAAPRRVWIAAETSWARVPVDQTGFRAYDLAKLPVKDE